MKFKLSFGEFELPQGAWEDRTSHQYSLLSNGETIASVVVNERKMQGPVSDFVREQKSLLVRALGDADRVEEETMSHPTLAPTILFKYTISAGDELSFRQCTAVAISGQRAFLITISFKASDPQADEKFRQYVQGFRPAL